MMRINLFDSLSTLLNYSEFLVRKLFYSFTFDWHGHDSYLYYSKTDLDQEIYEIYESNHEATWEGCAKAIQKGLQKVTHI